ncbi:globin-coupled sensor protein [Heyndrickxia ginsengihumi]|uniref:globin-coupled sensor protein n=1 Tax=Heyndrickxia ginsengihumi TaxID=363870 RepID=UPI00203D8E1C|nr:globin-coupled sensor protein [Heyndrickxia ginsengihumi]MCM3021930.1 globin-coupled sensor protein [Heyndrickxia ginsengihumi]
MLKMVRNRRGTVKAALRDVELTVDKNSEVFKQIELIGLTIDDLQKMLFLKPIVIERIDVIVDRFYHNLENEPTLFAIINDHSSIERLKITLKNHISEMFDGKINETYFEKRIRIAHVHVKIGLPTKWYMCAFQDLFLSICNIIEENITNVAEHASLIRSVSKIFSLEQQLVVEAYDIETEKQKRKVEEHQKIMENDVEEVENFAALSEETNASFHQLNAQSNEIIDLANKGADLSVLAEERAKQGKQQLSKQHVNMQNIYTSVNDISDDVQILLGITKQMQEIINIVTDISDQTNLLSLNAAIEAARAGEHGLGFAVVADEVRKLSDETKKSVANVASLISSMDGQTEKLTRSLEKIRAEVKDGKQSMEETEEHFEQILLTMEETKIQNNKIDNKLVSFINVLNELGTAFEEVAKSASNLTMFTRALN